MEISDAAYIAGLFDCEGSVDFAKRKEKKRGKIYTVQRILMRIEMTDEDVLNWVHEKLGVGTVRKRNRSPSVKAHWRIVGFTLLDLDKHIKSQNYCGLLHKLNYIR